MAGGRFGEVIVWSLYDDDEAKTRDRGRKLQLHSRTTSVGQIRLERGLLVSADGLGIVALADFWGVAGAQEAAKH